MTEYVTTNIRLPKAMHERVKKVAQQRNKSFAQVIRESLVEYLVETKTQQPPDDEGFDDPIYGLGELASEEEIIGGERPTDTSFRHDHYLYDMQTPDKVSGERDHA